MQWSGLRQLFVAALLTLSVGVHVVEFTGHWDHTIQDANDEAGIVGVTLCVGATLFAAGTLLHRIRPSRVVVSRSIVTDSTRLQHTFRVLLPTPTNGPPLSLRL